MAETGSKASQELRKEPRIGLREAIVRSRAHLCLDCGKCTGVCPVSRINRTYSPRHLLIRALRDDGGEVAGDKALWECLACGLCSELCPVAVDYARLTRALRRAAHVEGAEPTCSHGGALRSLMRIQAAPELAQKRLDWFPPGYENPREGDTLYFVGCLPYFDAFFSDLGVATLDAARGTLKILTLLGMRPIMLPDERCCGHDLLWQGDEETFRKLAEHNLLEIRKTGARRVVFSCPECYRTFKLDYAEHFGPLGFEVAHIAEVAAAGLSSGQLSAESRAGRVTFQDPCRLGRHLKVYEAPRAVLRAIPGLDFAEMERSGPRGACCGVSAWMSCDVVSKSMQVDRLKEAGKTGAATLVTACPKCEIHLKCALADKGVGESCRIEVKDLAALAAEALA
jgi:Fe-S oxidoreductase